MPGTPRNEVGTSRFRDAVEPFSTMLGDLVDAGFRAAATIDNAPRQPAAESRAMADLAAESRYAGAWDDAPVATATSHATLLLTAAEDAIATFAHAVLADRTPVYSYVVLARSGLECLGLALWMIEPTINTGERIKRSLNERLTSAYEQKRLPAELNPEPGRVTRLRSATALGYELTPSRKSSRRYFEPGPPTITEHVKRVLGNDHLGKLLYSFSSAVSHGTLWGLSEAIEQVNKESTDPVVRGAIKVTSRSIGSLACALAIAHSRAFGAFTTYMDWEVEGWPAAKQRAMDLIGAFTAGHQAPTDVQPEWPMGTPGGLWLPEHGAPSAWRLPRPG